MPVTPPPHTPRRILLLADCVGGVWQYSLELAAGLAAHQIEVVLAVAGPQPTPARRAEAEAITGLRLQPLAAALDWQARNARDLSPLRSQLIALAGEAEFDLIHLNGAALGDLPIAQPVVATQHSCLATWWQAMRSGEALPQNWRWYRARTAAGLAAAAAVIVPSASFADRLRRVYGSQITLDVVHNGRTLRAPRGDAAPRRWWCWPPAGSGTRPRISAPWTPRRQESAGPCWRPARPVGRTGRRFALKHVVALGTLDGAALEDRLRRASVFASLAIYEPFGLAVLEAALAGCALVLSDTATFRELWQDAALFVPPDDPSAARDAINGLIAEPELRLRLGARARARAGAYTQEACVRGTLAVYRRVLGQTSSTPVAPPLRAAG